MNQFLKVTSVIMITILAFIGLVNLNVLMSHQPIPDANKGTKDLLSHFIFVEKTPSQFETHKTINFDNFNLTSLYKLSRNLKLVRKEWCQLNSSICKDLLSYSLAREDWKYAENITKAICYDYAKCPLAKYVKDLRKKELLAKAQVNHFYKKHRLPLLVDSMIRDTNLPIDGVICLFAAKEYRYKCHWQNQKLVFHMDKKLLQKSFEKCQAKNSLMDCWIDSRIKMGTVSNQLTKACTLDSPAACYQMGLQYQKEGLRFMAKKYFEKACLLKFSNACLILGAEYAKLGDETSKEYYELKACHYQKTCEQRAPANVRN